MFIQVLSFMDKSYLRNVKHVKGLKMSFLMDTVPKDKNKTFYLF